MCGNRRSVLPQFCPRYFPPWPPSAALRSAISPLGCLCSFVARGVGADPVLCRPCLPAQFHEPALRPRLPVPLTPRPHPAACPLAQGMDTTGSSVTESAAGRPLNIEEVFTSLSTWKAHGVSLPPSRVRLTPRSAKSCLMEGVDPEVRPSCWGGWSLAASVSPSAPNMLALLPRQRHRAPAPPSLLL